MGISPIAAVFDAPEHFVISLNGLQKIAGKRLID